MSSGLLRILALLGIISLLMLSATPPTVADENDSSEDGTGEDTDGDVEDEDIDSMSVNGESIYFGVPDQDDDFHALHIPDDFRCEACKIIAIQFQTAFDKANEKRPSLKKNLPESAIIDVLEAECEDDYMHVGVKEVDGIKHLSGPGMPTQDAVGIMAGGGKWPIRMKALCGDIVGEVEEDKIYQLYKDGKLKSHLCLVDYPASNCITVDKSSGMKRIEL